MHAEPPLEDSLAVFFSNHMGQAMNSIHDKWWKTGILPLEWDVTDKQKERNGIRAHHLGTGNIHTSTGAKSRERESRVYELWRQKRLKDLKGHLSIGL